MVNTTIDWVAFENGSLCVGFYNEEAYHSFLQECEERGFMWVSGKRPTDAFNFTYDKLIYCCGCSKLALGTEEQRKYMKKFIALPKFTLRQILREQKSGTYENDAYILKVDEHDGNLSIQSKGGECVNVHSHDVFYPTEMKLTFMEALQAYNDGKTIRSLKTFRTYDKVEAHKWQGEMVRFSEINEGWEIIDQNNILKVNPTIQGLLFYL